MNPKRLSYTLPPVMFALAALPTQTTLAANTVITDEYIYIGIEAESGQNIDTRWVLTEPGTPAQADDPDGNHSDLAAGNAYLELLPDIRVTHDDPMGPPDAYWGQPGTGPQADFPVEIPEPGRYYVHVRAYSTGTEDNGLHIGADGNWPASGARMQWCSAAKKAWWWSSAQRDAGGNGSCGMEKTIWLDFTTAGSHTVSISAREDGFEIDRLALIKDLSGNTRVCSPVDIDGVTCKNGSIESADGFIDLRTTLSVEPASVLLGEQAVVTVSLENLDAFDTATGVNATLTPASGLTVVSADPACTAVNDTQVCSLASLAPTAPNENHSFVFTVSGDAAGALAIEATATANEADSVPGNDTATATLSVGTLFEATDIALAGTASDVAPAVGDSVSVTYVVSNPGAATATGVLLTVALPGSLTLDELPANCEAASPLGCDLGDIDAGGSAELVLSLSAATVGAGTLSAGVSADNDAELSNNAVDMSLTVVEPTDTSDPGTGTNSGSTDGTDTGSTGDTVAPAIDGTGDTGSGGGNGPLLLALLAVFAGRRQRRG